MRPTLHDVSTAFTQDTALIPSTDLLIIGGGPAGSAAAIEAGRAGLDVVLIDKATFPREKCCGDGLTASALRHLEALGLDPVSVPSWQPVDDVRVVSPSGRQMLLPLPKGQGHFSVVARRSELDHALLELARRHRAQVYEGVELTGLRQDDDGVMATTSHGEIRAAAVIAADGMWSPARKYLGLAPEAYRGEWHAFRQYVRNVAPAAQRELIVWFDADLLPGYIWSFPLADGSANIGFGIQRGRNHRIQEMKKLWLDILDRPHIAAVLGPDAEPEGPHKAWPIPARLGELPITAGRVFFVGDAVAATDPMTGEGIGQAIETGRHAAQRIAAYGQSDVASAASDYERELRSGMVKDHRLAATLSNLLANHRLATLSVAIADTNDWSRRNFGRWLFEDYPRAVLGTPKRWERSLFTRPGAYADRA